jgi:phage terminase large subunit-like protein
MKKANILDKLIDKTVVKYFNNNEKHFNTQLNEFIETNTPCIFGIDFSNSNDMTAIINVPIRSKE